MNELDKARTEIDTIDEQIIKLYEKRMEIVKKVIEYKIKNNIAIFDSNRESAMLEKNLKKIQNEEYKTYYANVLKGFTSASKEMQNDILKAHNK